MKEKEEGLVIEPIRCFFCNKTFDEMDELPALRVPYFYEGYPDFQLKWICSCC